MKSKQEAQVGESQRRNLENGRVCFGERVSAVLEWFTEKEKQTPGPEREGDSFLAVPHGGYHEQTPISERTEFCCL